MEKQFLIDDLKLGESWRLFKIMGEFVEGVEGLHDLGPAVSIFGSARIAPSDPQYKKADMDIVQVLDEPEAIVDSVRRILVV